MKQGFIFTCTNKKIRPNTLAQVITIKGNETQIALYLVWVQNSYVKDGINLIWYHSIDRGKHLQFTALEIVNEREIRFYFQIYNDLVQLKKVMKRTLEEHLSYCSAGTFMISKKFNCIFPSPYFSVFPGVRFESATKPLERRQDLVDELKLFCDRLNSDLEFSEKYNQ